jgi:hypothetical protein
MRHGLAVDQQDARIAGLSDLRQVALHHRIAPAVVAERLEYDTGVWIGSPEHGVKGAGRHGAERYPANVRRWANFSARGEMVALHPRLAPFFRDMVGFGLVDAIEDHAGLYNHFHGENGIDAHKSYGYLIHASVAGLIGDWLAEAD